MTHGNSDVTLGPGRRSVVRGAAWSAPVVALATAAPASAAVSGPQPQPGLQGWVRVRKDCSGWTDLLEWDSAPSVTKAADPFVPETWGLWVYNTQADWVFTNARITVFVPTAVAAPVISAATGNSNWSLPTLVTSDLAGYRAYQTTYSGTWSYHAASGTYLPYTEVNGRLHFLAELDLTASQCAADALSVGIRRCVTIQRGATAVPEDICFDRFVQL